MTQYVISLTASLGVLSLFWRRGDLPVCGCTVFVMNGAVQWRAGGLCFCRASGGSFQPGESQ